MTKDITPALAERIFVVWRGRGRLALQRIGGKIRKIAHEFLARAVRFQIRQDFRFANAAHETPNLVSLVVACITGVLLLDKSR